MVVGGLPKGPDGRPVSKDIAGARQMVRDGLAELLEYARASAMPLAIEPLHPMYAGDRACVNTMEHANDLCDELGSGIGIAVDVYHVWWDPQLKAQIERAARAGEKRILAFHVCDWLVPTMDLLNDRGMMGDGVIDIRLIRSWVEAAGYRGLHEVEIFSAANWWKRDGDEVLATCQERHRQYV
jgi:sugar phosphate isomerase/epimerase